MKSLAWKLAIVAAVVGVGSLVMLQAQRAMNQSMLSKSAENQNREAGGGAAPDDAPPFNEVVAQSDAKTDAAPKSPAPDISADKEKQSPAKAAPTPEKDEASSPNNPFAEMNDEPQSLPAKDSKKTASASGNDIKQTSANADENSQSAGPALNAGPPNDVPPLKTVTDAPQLPPGESAPPLEAKSPKMETGQAEPQPTAPEQTLEPSSNPEPQSSNEKGDSPAAKSSAGPQLMAPVANTAEGQPAPALSNSPDSKPVATDANAGPAMLPSAEDPKTKGSGPALGVQEPPTFPAVEKNDKQASPAGGQGAPEKTAASDETGVPKQQTPFPTDAATAPPAAKTVTPQPTDSTVFPSPPKGALGKSSPQPDSGPDFQGDGTVSETAPLGPQRPQLNIEKIAPQNALLGQPLIYLILVKNIGTSEAHDVVVEDRIPKGTKLSGTIPRAEMSGKRLAWRIGNLAPGEQRKISIRVIPLEAGEVGSVATVNFVAEAAAETVVTAPRIEFELSAPKTAKLGELIPLHFRVKNVGTGEARRVVIRDLIPESLSHSAGNDLEYEVGRLPPGRSKELTLDLKAVKVGSAVNKAVVIGEGGISVEAKADIEVQGSKVSITRSGPSRRYLGRTALFSNTLLNQSKYEVENVVVVETVPPGMEFTAATHGGQFNENTRTVAWRIDRMAAGETQVIKTKLTPKTAGNQISTVRVTVPNGEPSETKSTMLAEGFAALAVEVQSVDSPIDVGERVTLRINARNKGTIPATNLIVTVEIPDQMIVKSARGPEKHAQEGNRLRFPVSTLEGRTAAMCEVVLEAQKRGDSRIKVRLQADQVEKPLTREESILVLSESSEPAATH